MASPALTVPEQLAAREAVARALREDLGPDGLDLTAAALPADRVVDGEIVARGDGVVCGMPIAREVFLQRGPDVTIHADVADGTSVVAGTVLAKLRGPAPQLLTCERVALNFLQRLSGVATLTRAYVDAIAGTRASILDTRKTTPGLRALERYAVRCGGGSNHRFGLFSEAMIKDNHIDAVGMSAATAAIRTAHPGVSITIEARTLGEVREAASLLPQLILLDNMSLDQLRAAVVLVGDVCPTEASGGVTLQTAAQIAATGVDRISVGALTHSAPALDIALDLT